jgi:UDP-N-acetylmuramate: L-alanyl-gamma-D-glutamyl-meso-diaminopimelate ligase
LNIYFLGIAGAGMSALASVLLSEGHRVCGSDLGVFPPVSAYLDRMGIPWRDGFEARLVPADVDLAIIGSSAKLGLASNPELAELKRRGTPCAHYPEFLGRHTRQRENLVVAGSFGKSTLSALIAVALREGGRDPGYFIGAAPIDLQASGAWGSDRLFVLEGDEYIIDAEDRRPKFLLYHPHGLLISSVVHDHVNAFPTSQSYEHAFAQLIDLLPREGLLVCAAGFPALRRLTEGRVVVWYGREACEGYFARNIQVGEVTRFDLVTPGKSVIALETQLLGLHNIENIVGAAAVLLERGDIDAEALRQGVRMFRGVERRLDKKTNKSSVPAYEGFGSSYEKARSAIEAMRLHFPARPLVVIFEPHTFSWRNAEALAWYDTVFEGAARVLLMPPPEHGADGHDQVSQGQILGRIRAAGVPAQAADGPAEALSWLEQALSGPEVVLLLSSGPMGGLTRSAPAMLEARFG